MRAAVECQLGSCHYPSLHHHMTGNPWPRSQVASESISQSKHLCKHRGRLETPRLENPQQPFPCLDVCSQNCVNRDPSLGPTGPTCSSAQTCLPTSTIPASTDMFQTTGQCWWCSVALPLYLQIQGGLEEIIKPPNAITQSTYDSNRY